MGKPPDDTTTDQLSSRRLDVTTAPGLAVVFENGAPTLRVVVVHATPLVIGRGSEARFLIEDELLSRVHCAVSFDRSTGWTIEDRSRHGTFIDGRQISGRAAVVAPRTMRIGDSVLVFAPDVTPLMGQTVERREGGIIVGPWLRAVESEIVAAARAGSDLLVTGETGTGKEWAAGVYRRTRKRPGPTIDVNSAALPREIFEAEVFGYVAGAFSGATRDTPGLFEAAHGGTLFFDEIGDLPLDVQPKLLRALQERKVRRLGERHERVVDVAVIAATNRDLRAEIRRGTFRDDLFYRLDQASVRLPALRERPEDLPVVVAEELRSAQAPPPSPSLIDEVLLREWRGNFRELVSALKVAARNGRTARRVSASHLPPRPAEPTHDESTDASRGSYRPALSAAEIQNALREHEGNVSKAARSLGVHRNTLYRYMLQLGIQP